MTQLVALHQEYPTKAKKRQLGKRLAKQKTVAKG